MKTHFWVGSFVALAAFGAGCSSDDSTTGGSAGRGGGAGSTATGTSTGGRAGAGGTVATGSGGGGATGTAGTAGAAGSTGGTGGGAGGAGGATGGGGMGGMGGTGMIDPCEGKFHPLPFTVSTAFTNQMICSGGTCTAAAMPYFFAPIPNPNCDETFPEAGIVPPFSDAGADASVPDAGTDDGGSNADAADADPDATATADTDGGAPSETGTTDGTAPDVSVGSDAGTDASAETGAADAKSDSPAAPSCYEFLYNPNCTSAACWGGVIFTQSAGGIADPGVCIENGATKITFQAKASRPGARIKFGSIREGMNATEFFLNITTDWATYQVSIPPGEPYNAYSSGMTGVWNGFSVIVEPQDHPGGTYIFVKDAVWSK